MSEQPELREKIKLLSIETAKLLGATAYSALFFAPHAAQHTLDHTSADVQIADFPAKLSFQPQASRVDVLNQATIYTDHQKWGIGLKAEVTGLPRFGNGKELISYFSPERLNVYASLAETPQQAVDGYRDILADDARQRFLTYERNAALGGGLIIYSGLHALAYRRRLKNLAAESKEQPIVSPLYLGGLAAMAVAGSLSVAQHSHSEWQQSSPRPDKLTTISALDETPLEGTATDNAWMLNVLNRGIVYADKLKDRRQSQREEYLQTVTPKLTEGILSLPDLRDNEELVFVMTDMHSGQAGINLSHHVVSTLQERYGSDAVRAVLNVGDLSYGAEFQRQSVLDQSFKEEDVETIVARGNHDVGPVADWIKDADMHDLEGRYDIDGLSLYGQPDPQQTPLFESSFYPDDFTNTDLGAKVREELNSEPADILALHQPAALQEFIGVPSIEEYLLSDEDSALTDCDFGIGTIASLPTSLANAGHWHDQYPLKMVCAEDGTWSVVNVQGSGGGANESPTPNSWSDPDGRPIRPVVFRAFVHNTEYSSITGSVNIEISPGSIVSPIERIDIGTEDGAPFLNENETAEIDANQPATTQQPASRNVKPS